MMHKASEIGLASVVPKAYFTLTSLTQTIWVLKAKHWVGFGLTNQPVHEGLNERDHSHNHTDVLHCKYVIH